MNDKKSPDKVIKAFIKQGTTPCAIKPLKTEFSYFEYESYTVNTSEILEFWEFTCCITTKEFERGDALLTVNEMFNVLSNDIKNLSAKLSSNGRTCVSKVYLYNQLPKQKFDRL